MNTAAPRGKTRGRRLFALGRPMLLLAARVLRLAPGAFLNAFWTWSDLVPGVLGIAVRYAIAKARLGACGDNVLFGPGVEVRGWREIRIGSNVSIHRGCYVDGAGGLTIGDDVSIAHAVSILTADHTWDDEALPIRDNPLKNRPVSIANDVWIGCGVRILAGSSIRSRAVVAAGAVVRNEVDERTVVGGVPARVLRRL